MQVIGLNYKIEQVIGLIRSSFQTSFKFLLSDKHISFRIFCTTPVKQRKVFWSNKIRQRLGVY